jgi:chromosome segregation ATPase
MMAGDLADQLSTVLAPVVEAFGKATQELRTLDTEIVASTRQSDALAENERGLRHLAAELQIQVAQALCEVELAKSQTSRDLAAARAQAHNIILGAEATAVDIRKAAAKEAAAKVSSATEVTASIEEAVKEAQNKLRSLQAQCEVAQRKLERIKSAAADFAKA